jgi:rhodanese-related sulfurtransferase
LPFQEIVILDVREPAEIAEGNIPFSLPLPLSVLPDAITTPLEEWESKFGFKKPRRDQPIVVYCRSGRRSTSAMEMMQEADVDRRFTKYVRLCSSGWGR